MKPALVLLLLALLAACAAPAPERPAAPPPPPVVQTPAQALAALPGAEPLDDEAVGIRYPGEILFGSGAVLPLPGGPDLLDPLAELLAAHPGSRWLLRVRAATELGDAYDERLAAERAEILARYLTRRGVAAERLEWRIEAGEGAPLEVQPAP
ncbi:hypothetical protein [Geoalkalibacter halelectricus]|uniref:hypothetical protein n=1 Tax=Geoalkalibacter halelectricus TaxID=2847045 RepID=UPI003D1E0F75